MTDYETARTISIILGAVNVLVPLAGAVVAATFLRRRGRNARLAMIGCLVTAVSPILVSVLVGFAMEDIYDEYGIVAAVNAPTLLSLPFHLTGLGLIVAGALVTPRPQQLVYMGGPYPAPPQPPTDQPPAGTDARA
ncbi:hypothetical protein [Kitasatospora sp. NBC_00458]|uniref:hypothetical protein n=1 Tax=Kitasatospora sp. NBC_00458 TaxID=2903568 RepID=UPI002E18BE0F